MSLFHPSFYGNAIACARTTQSYQQTAPNLSNEQEGLTEGGVSPENQPASQSPLPFPPLYAFPTPSLHPLRLLHFHISAPITTTSTGCRPPHVWTSTRHRYLPFARVHLPLAFFRRHGCRARRRRELRFFAGCDGHGDGGCHPRDIVRRGIGENPWYRAVPDADPDFAEGDLSLVDVGRAPDFPFDSPLESYDRLAWRMNHPEANEVVLDCKSGLATWNWLVKSCVATKKVAVFFVRFRHSTELYAVPRSAVQALYYGWDSAKKGVIVPFKTSLARYVISEKYLSEFLERLVRGSSDKTAFCESRQGRMMREFEWRGRLRPCRIEIPNPRQSQSFDSVWRLTEWLHRTRSPAQLFHTRTQPLAGDFSIKVGRQEFTIQHKFIKDYHTEWFADPGLFDFLLQDLGSLLSVWFRDGTLCGQYEYTDAGAKSLVTSMETEGEKARKLNIEFQERHLGGGDDLRESDDGESDDGEGEDGEGEDGEGEDGEDEDGEDEDGEGKDGEDGDGFDDESGEKPVKKLKRLSNANRRFAWHFCDYVNRGDCELQAQFLDSDQMHPFGEAIVFKWRWTPQQRRAYRDNGVLPVSLASLREREQSLDCVVLRFCFRDYSDRVNEILSAPFFPLEASGTCLPVTGQPFFLICASDESSIKNPYAAMFVPSELLLFPPAVYKEWEHTDKIRRNNAERVEFYRQQRVGDVQDSRASWGTLTARGVVQSRLWLPPLHIVQHLERVLDGTEQSMAVKHPEVPIDKCATFQPRAYITTTDEVVEIGYSIPSLRISGHFEARRTGYLGRATAGSARQRAKAKQRKEGSGGAGRNRR
ncbi:hypothetical protein DM02DRAFT_365017 [Periconia macrospinosa]|uniref:Uncharacterized protein n=1 Tax=Periconia macrospinosa TaxID=97972 RepID=A0A2V1DSM8_9PLEO|nr:hypothetical protein DM02DRAFT_365017 [Periconia macrospinosa]